MNPEWTTELEISSSAYDYLRNLSEDVLTGVSEQTILDLFIRKYGDKFRKDVETFMQPVVEPDYYAGAAIR